MYNPNFVAIVTIHTTIKNQEKVYPSGFFNDWTESISNFIATKIIDKLISNEKIYSAFPWPKLCDSSLGLLAILFPINVIHDEKISPALLTLSAIIAWLFVINPIIPFIISKKTLPMIPKILAFFVDLYLSILLIPLLIICYFIFARINNKRQRNISPA